MYAFIKGKITDINPKYIVLENNGIGYLIIVPNPYDYKKDMDYKVYTHHYVREDINNLYGFLSMESKNLFLNLISVKGIGPKTALSILATNQINQVIDAIENNDAKYLTKFPGIGMKSAQQIILDLKGKLIETDNINDKEDLELVEALQTLGYSKREINKVLKKIDKELKIEEKIKIALQKLNE